MFICLIMLLLMNCFNLIYQRHIYTRDRRCTTCISGTEMLFPDARNFDTSNLEKRGVN